MPNTQIITPPPHRQLTDFKSDSNAGAVINDKGYNPALDILKGIACIAVIFMHCEFPGKLGVLIQCISRFCVPLFFMVSGYFCYNRKTDEIRPLKPKIKHIFKIVIIASLFYFALTILYNVCNWYGYYGLSLNKGAILIWGIFNQPFFGSGQMWFLWALLYVYIIFSIIKSLHLQGLIQWMMPLLCIVYIVLAQGLHIMHISVPNFLYRNAYIEGLAFFLMGYWINRYKDKLNLTNTALIIIAVIATLFCPIERLLLGRDFGVNICSFPQVFALYMLAIKNPHFGGESFEYLRLVGQKHSMMIYILHPFVWHVLQQLYTGFDVENNIGALYIMPLLVVAITFALSIIYNKFHTNYEYCINKKNSF